jgi:hypothetical protein
MRVQDFIRQYNPIKVNTDSTETGDLRLMCPEEADRALQYQQQGYQIASVYELIEHETDRIREEVFCDNDAGRAYHKIGYFVYETQYRGAFMS